MITEEERELLQQILQTNNQIAAFTMHLRQDISEQQEIELVHALFKSAGLVLEAADELMEARAGSPILVRVPHLMSNPLSDEPD